MNKQDLQEQILELLGREKARPLSVSDIRNELKVPGKAGKRIQKALAQLVRRGEIVEIRNGKYALGAPADLVTGKLKMLRSGRAFVESEDGRDMVSIPRERVSTALPGDRVVVRMEAKAVPESGERSDAREGRVIRVLERVSKDIVGTLQSTGRFFYVVPLDPRYQQDFYVPGAGEASIGDRVIVRFTEWENRHVNPEGEVVDVLGPADDPSVDTLSVLHQFHLSDEFPAEALDEAELAANRMQEPGDRLDLRDEVIFTIDPERARDFDDALSLSRDDEGRRVLGVHIADVSHFVRPGTALDQEARKRGNSVYLPDKVIPMLPEQLSNGVCSLRPDEDRLAFSVFLTLDVRGMPVERTFARSVIRSRARLTYPEAMDLLRPVVEGAAKPKKDAGAAAKPAGRRPGKEVVSLVREIHGIAQQLRKKRFARHALNLDVPECEIVMDGEGRMVGIRPVVNDESHQLIEECMIAANEAVAGELRDAGVPFLFRVHDKPSDERIEDLTAELVSMGYSPGNLSQRRNLARFLNSVQDDPLAYHVRVAVLKSMNRAVYASEAGEHFGLAKKTYSHFTSPIRRYPDLVLHRQLASYLDKRRGLITDHRELRGLGIHCSETEQMADEAERALIEIKKYRYLQAQLEAGKPKTFESVVVNVTNFGLFVELVDLQIQGLIHISSLSDRFVRYDKKSGALRAGKNAFRLGQRIEVRVTGVDFDKRRVDFVPV